MNGDIPKWQRPEPVEEHRTNIVKVRLTDSELNLIKEKNPYASISRFMRETTLNAARPTEPTPQQNYSKTEKDTLIALSRIGTNVNQIARAINVDVNNLNDIDKTKLLILLLDVEKQLKELRP